MRIRLTDISLDLPGRRLEIGETLVVGEDIPEDIAEMRLAAKTAVEVRDDEVSAALVDALEAFKAHALTGHAVLERAVDLVVGEADVFAFADALQEATTTLEAMTLSLRIRAILNRAEVATEALLAGHQASDAASVSTAAPESAAAPPAALEDPEGAKDAAASSDGSSEGATSPSSDDAAAAFAASDDNPRSDGGAEGDVAEASADAAPPAAAATNEVEQQAPAKTGGRKKSGAA